jgi:hypothetical protein
MAERAANPVLAAARTGGGRPYRTITQALEFKNNYDSREVPVTAGRQMRSLPCPSKRVSQVT